MAEVPDPSSSIRARVPWGLLAGGLLGAALLGLASGPLALSPVRILRAVAAGFGGGEVPALDRAVVWTIRGPRVALGVLVGACLATSGAALQALFRNPLAAPGVIGSTAGAALAAATAIVVGASLPGELRAVVGDALVPVAAFAGSLAATAAVYTVGRRQGTLGIATMLLAGVAIASLAGAGTGLLTYLADDQQLRDIQFWSLGSLGGSLPGPRRVAMAMMAVSLAALWRSGARLNGMLLGEADAACLGIDVEGVKREVVGWTALGVGAATSVCGSIGFVGLVVPHFLRLTLGPDNRALLPASGMAGAALLVLVDAACRVVVQPAELPLGVLTSLLGAPVFLALLLRGHAHGMLRAAG